MLDGVDIAQVVANAVARAGHGDYLVQPLLQSMVLQLITLKEVTPERVTAIAEELMPGVADDFISEAVVRMPMISTERH